jgi:hypothetical protein
MQNKLDTKDFKQRLERGRQGILTMAALCNGKSKVEVQKLVLETCSGGINMVASLCDFNEGKITEDQLMHAVWEIMKKGPEKPAAN